MSIEPKTESVQQLLIFAGETVGEAYRNAATWLAENDPLDDIGEDADLSSPTWDESAGEWSVVLYARADSGRRLDDMEDKDKLERQRESLEQAMEAKRGEANQALDLVEQFSKDLNSIHQAIGADEDEDTLTAVRQLAEAHRAAVDKAEDHWHTIELLADKLGVPYEPHQHFIDRLLEAAGRSQEAGEERVNGVLQRAQSAEIVRLRNRLAELEDRAGEARYYRAALEVAHQLMAGALPEGSPLMEAWRTMDKALEGTWMCGPEPKIIQILESEEKISPGWWTKPFRRKGGGHG